MANATSSNGNDKSFKADQDLFDLSNTLRASSSPIIIFVIGVPCSTINGLVENAAKSLDYVFISIDKEMQLEIGDTVDAYIDQNGKKSFHALQLNVFKRIMKNLNNTNVIIWCGDSIIETSDIRDILCQQKFVVYLNRDRDDILRDSIPTNNHHSYKDMNNIYESHQLFYRQCSQYEFCLLKHDNNWILIEKNFNYFLKRILRKKCPLKTIPSFFLSITIENLLNIDNDKFLAMIQGCDAIELRIDWLASLDMNFIGQQVAYIRKNAPFLRIIYTVRSQSQYGKFVNDEQLIFDLLTYGIRFGCEIIDMESHWNETIRYNWLKNNGDKHAYIIGCIHSETIPDVEQTLIKCSHNGLVDIIKIVINSTDITYILQFTTVCKLFKLADHQNMISLCMGEKGKLTRLLNVFMTPVTHPLLPFVAAKGQLTVEETQSLRHSLGLLESKRFYLFGKSIQDSLLPLLHQTGFDYLYLPYKYELYETDNFDTIETIIKQANFGGASISMPLKQFRLKLMDTVSDSVQEIGAINTIVKLANGHLYGDNTDWKAIYVLLNNTLLKPTLRTLCNALLIGTGEIARAALYALKKLTFTGIIFLYDPQNPLEAKDLAKDNIVAVSEQNELKNQNIHLIISTLPGASKFIVEDNFLFQDANSLPIVFDVNYIPYNTDLIEQAQKFNCHIIRGIDLFIEQGLEQFQSWTNRVDIVRLLIEQTIEKRYIELYG
jgi:pentafunctional AROM polypeptide